jgi:hypothetical protein
VRRKSPGQPPEAFSLSTCVRSSGCANEVKNDRDHGQYQENVDEKRGDVKHEETAHPKYQQQDPESEKHG